MIMGGFAYNYFTKKAYIHLNFLPTMRLKKSKLIPNSSLKIYGSKSESNRLLILQKLFECFEIKNLSHSQDTQLLQTALSSTEKVIDIHHAGTAMRFLTAFFAIQKGRETVLTGSGRMKERPIKPLVDALRDLGADIEYIQEEGFPPLKIIGKKLCKNEVKIPAHISSQFITALMLIGTKLKHGLTIELIGKITSRPYLEMTLQQLKALCTEKDSKNIKFVKNIIAIPKISHLKSQISVVESDWSSASYFYSLSAIGREKITLQSFKKDSLQGDIALTDIYRSFFGIDTIFETINGKQCISLVPQKNFTFPQKITLDMNACPDIAQTLCVTASAMKIPFEIKGLETLKIKETDRLLALKNELAKIGAMTQINENTIASTEFKKAKENISICTYNDHRMAMSFAPFCLIQTLEIQNPNVVEKSYPNFWTDFHQMVQGI